MLGMRRKPFRHHFILEGGRPTQQLVDNRKKVSPNLVRAHFRNFWLGKAFFSRIWHAVVFTQFGNADSKSAPCQAIFCVSPTQNSKTKWPPKLVKMSQLYITAWLTMNIKHHFGVLKPTWATYLKSPEFHLVRLPLEDKIQNGRHCKAMCYNSASK